MANEEKTVRMTKIQKVSEYLTKKQVKHINVPSLNIVLIKVPDDHKEVDGVAVIKYANLDVFGLPVEVSENWYSEMFKTIIRYIVKGELSLEDLADSNIKTLTV